MLGLGSNISTANVGVVADVVQMLATFVLNVETSPFFPEKGHFLATPISGNMADPMFFCWQVPTCHRLMGCPLTGTCRRYYNWESLDFGRVNIITTKDDPQQHLLIPSAGASGPTVAPPQPQVPTPTLPPLLPLLVQWQQQRQHSLVACSGSAIAAVAAAAQPYCYDGGC